MEYYKQFNVVMNALDNRGELASISWSRGHLFFFYGGGRRVISCSHCFCKLSQQLASIHNIVY